jgi:hypothetical protein
MKTHHRKMTGRLTPTPSKALGRALAALGFGTHFADDHTTGAEPAPAASSALPAAAPQRSQTATKHMQQGDNGPADPVTTWTRNLRSATTPAALDRVIRAMAEHGLDTHPQLAPLIQERVAAVSPG